MPRSASLIPPEVIACMTQDRAPTVREVEDVAARIRTESATARSAFAWGELEARSREWAVALRAALMALEGSAER